MKQLEYWKPVPGYEGELFVSWGGKVFKKPVKKKTCSPWYSHGYPAINIHGKVKRVHRLIARAFIGTPPTPQHQINHKNFIRDGNRVENLEWVTALENVRHAIKHYGSFKPIAFLYEDYFLDLKGLDLYEDSHPTIKSVGKFPFPYTPEINY